MSEKNFCNVGEHSYKERDVLRSVVDKDDTLWLLICCEKCDSKFPREVERLL